RSFPEWEMAHVYPDASATNALGAAAWTDPRAMPASMVLAHLMALADACRRLEPAKGFASVNRSR
ncbi:MAG: hypothetical protein ACRC1H_07660, partial [Caldilineaceae bacterium]